MASNKDKLEVTLKLAILPFPTTVDLWEEEYLQVLDTCEYKGFRVQGVLMQELGASEVWRRDTGALHINPVWDTCGDEDVPVEELSDDCEV